MSKQQIALNIGLFATGTGIGFGVGYYLAKKKAEARADAEIASVKEVYSVLKAKDAYASPTELAMERGSAAVQNILAAQKERSLSDEEAAEHPEVLTEEQAVNYNKIDLVTNEAEAVAAGEPADEDGHLINTPTYQMTVDEYQGDLSPVSIDKSIFESDPGTAPSEVDMPDRDRENPYVITVDQFMNDEDDFNQERVQLTYWEGSDTLADERGVMMDRVNETIGDENLMKFGLGSKDRNIVYVRNEKIGADYEIVKDERSYYTVVLGAPDPEATQKRSPGRMREGD